MGDSDRIIYVDVETAVSFPLRILMANAMTDPIKVPNWKITKFRQTSVAAGRVVDKMRTHPRKYRTFYPCPFPEDSSS